MNFKRWFLIIACAGLPFTGRQSAAQEGPEGNKSPVPQYTFSTTLEEQEAELKMNPLLQRFNDSRKKMEENPHRPIYHYVNHCVVAHNIYSWNKSVVAKTNL